MRELPLDLQEIIYLRYVEELSPGLIAEICEISLGAVYVRLHRARKQLKRQLESGRFIHGKT